MCIQIINVLKCKREETEKKPRLKHIGFIDFVRCVKALIKDALPCEGDNVNFKVGQSSNVVQETNIEHKKCPVCNKLPGAAFAVKGKTIGDIWKHYLYQKERDYYSINRDKERSIGEATINGIRVQTRPEGWLSIFIDVEQRRPVYKVNPNYKIVNVLVEVGGKRHVYEFEEIKSVPFLRFSKEGEELVDEEEK